MSNQKITIIIGHDKKNVPYESFMSVVSQTVSLLRSIDRKTEPEHKLSVKWGISHVSMQSPLHLTLEATSLSKERVVTKRITKPFIEDINRLEKGQRPKHFTLNMEQRAKRIVGVLSNGITSLRFESDDLEARPTQHLAAYVDDDLKQYMPYYEIGSIEGMMDIVSVKDNKDTLQIKDLRFGTEVICKVSAIQLEEAKDLLRKRIVVRGRIRYSKKRPQVIVDVFDLRELKDSKHAPQPEDIGPVDLMGGIDPVDYLRGDYCKKTS